MADEDDCCCGCCVGLAIGLVLSGGVKISFADTGETSLSLEQTVISEKQDRESIENKNILLKGIGYYQEQISPQIKEKLGKDRLCRYEPSCSEYAKQAIEQHGAVTGAVMATARLARCNPLSEGGNDPVGTPWYAKKIF